MWQSNGEGNRLARKMLVDVRTFCEAVVKETALLRGTEAAEGRGIMEREYEVGEHGMNHKRKRPANRRAGCKMCKPWKSNGCKELPPRDRRLTQDGIREILEQSAERAVELDRKLRRIFRPPDSQLRLD